MASGQGALGPNRREGMNWSTVKSARVGVWRRARETGRNVQYIAYHWGPDWIFQDLRFLRQITGPAIYLGVFELLSEWFF